MRITLIIFAFFVGYSLAAFSQEETPPTPMETLSSEYCGCVTRLGNIVGDPLEVMSGCLRIFHLGNPNFAAVDAETYNNTKGEDISLLEANWATIGKTIDWAFENCGYVKKRADASRKEEIKAELLERRKEAQVEHREEEVAKEVMDLIFDDRWDEIGFYCNRPMQYAAQKESLQDKWIGFDYTPDLHSYTTNKETTDDQLVFTWQFYQEGRTGIAFRVQIRFKADAAFEKVAEIWMGS